MPFGIGLGGVVYVCVSVECSKEDARENELTNVQGALEGFGKPTCPLCLCLGFIQDNDIATSAVVVGFELDGAFDRSDLVWC